MPSIQGSRGLKQAKRANNVNITIHIYRHSKYSKLTVAKLKQDHFVLEHIAIYHTVGHRMIINYILYLLINYLCSIS